MLVCLSNVTLIHLVVYGGRVTNTGRTPAPVWLTGDDTGLNKAILSVYHYLEVEPCLTGSQ